MPMPVHGIGMVYTWHIQVSILLAKSFHCAPKKNVDGTSRVVRVCRLPQLQQWLARVLVGFFHSSFCGLWFWFWFCLLSGHDCVPASSSAPSPPSTGKNAINFRPCFYFCFFFLFSVFGFVTYRFRSNDFFRPLFMCISFVSGSCSLDCPCFSLNFHFPLWNPIGAIVIFFSTYFL